MDHNKFRVGQIVTFASPEGPAVRGTLTYKILRRLPHDGAAYAYQIKTIMEPFDHVARECEIELIEEHQPMVGNHVSGAVLHFASIAGLAAETAI